MGCGSSNSVETVQSNNAVATKPTSLSQTKGSSSSNQKTASTSISKVSNKGKVESIITEVTPQERRLQNEFKEHLNIVIKTLNEEIKYFESDEQPSQDVGWLPAWAVWKGHWRPEEWRKLYTDRCRERIKTFEYFNRRGRLHNDNITSGVDPNKCVFPLCPDWLKPEDLREYYTKDYKVFDVALAGQAWRVYDLNMVHACPHKEVHTCFVQQLKPWLNNWQPFDMQIDGEAGWHVIRQNLCQNDVTTEDQREVLNARAKRTDLEDKDRMTRRRNALAKRFAKRYNIDADALLVAVQSWASTIAAGEQRFIKLCNK